VLVLVLLVVLAVLAVLAVLLLHTYNTHAGTHTHTHARTQNFHVFPPQGTCQMFSLEARQTFHWYN
jgi:hypothetical protein